MKKYLKKNLIFVLVIIVGVISAMVSFTLRYSAEVDNRNYDLIVEYNDLVNMAAQSGMTEDQWLEFFKSEGIDTFAVCQNETTQFSYDAADMLKAKGFTVVPVASYSTAASQDFSSYVSLLKKYDSPYSIFFNFKFDYSQYVTSPSWDELLQYLKDSNTMFGIVERDNETNGGYDLLENSMKAIDYNAVGTFYEWMSIQNRYKYHGYEGSEEISNALCRAVAERNARIIIFRMILDPSSNIAHPNSAGSLKYITDTAEYSMVLRGLESRLARLGYQRGDIRSIEFGVPSIGFRIVEGFGVVAAALLLLDVLFIFDRKHKTIYVLGLIGMAGVLALALVKTELYKIILSIGGGIVMPSLAATLLCRVLRDKLDSNEFPCQFSVVNKDAAMYLIVFAIISFIGSIFVVGALSEINYMLEIRLYRGVKFMQLMAIVIYCFAFFYIFFKDQQDLIPMLKSDMRKYGKYIVVLCIIAVFGGLYYILRTGNANIASGVELKLRAWLENILLARPRTKELLIGWPCLMLFVWAKERRLKYLPFFFGCGMIIGMTSIVNTFLHIRIQLGISLLRSGWGLLIGLGIGVILVALAEMIFNFVTKRAHAAGK